MYLTTSPTSFSKPTQPAAFSFPSLPIWSLDCPFSVLSFIRDFALLVARHRHTSSPALTYTREPSSSSASPHLTKLPSSSHTRSKTRRLHLSCIWLCATVRTPISGQYFHVCQVPQRYQTTPATSCKRSARVTPLTSSQPTSSFSFLYLASLLSPGLLVLELFSPSFSVLVLGQLQRSNCVAPSSSLRPASLASNSSKTTNTTTTTNTSFRLDPNLHLNLLPPPIILARSPPLARPTSHRIPDLHLHVATKTYSQPRAHSLSNLPRRF